MDKPIRLRSRRSLGSYIEEPRLQHDNSGMNVKTAVIKRNLGDEDEDDEYEKNNYFGEGKNVELV